MTPLLKLEIAVFLAFIASSFRVTEEDWLSETDLSGPPSFFWMFSLLLKELIFIFLSVLGPILFLAYINDLPEQVKSRVRLFSDDAAMYLAISSTTEGQVLQTDLACLEQWEKIWDMHFNPSKCQDLHITRKVILNP